MLFSGLVPELINSGVWSKMFHGRKLTMKRFSLLLDEDNILLFYIKKAPLFKGEI